MSSIAGTVIAAKITTGDTTNTYPVAEANDILGGHHAVATLAERDAIPAERRVRGMTCYCGDTGLTYQLREGIDNGAWVKHVPTTLGDISHTMVNQTSVPTMQANGSWSYAAAGVQSLASKNLHDPSGAVDGMLLGNSDGKTWPYANGMVTSYIAVTPGVTYTIWLPASINGYSPTVYYLPHCYTSNDTHLGLQGYNGYSGLTVITFGYPYKQITFTVNDTNIAKVRFALGFQSHTTQQFTDTMYYLQCEAASAPTSFAPWGSVNTLVPPGDYNFPGMVTDIATLKTQMATANSNISTLQSFDARSQHVKIIVSSSYYYIRTPWDDSNDLVQRVIGTDFYGAYLHAKTTPDSTIVSSYTTGTKLAAQQDEHCPVLYNGTYIGGGHGPSYGMQITANSHGKTSAADLGSTWSDGVRNWTIINVVDGNTLMLLSDNLGTGSKWSFATSINGSTLTHVQNATNTGNISFSASTGQVQLLPCRKNLTISAYIDNQKITVDGTYLGTTADVRFTYDLIDLNDLLVYYKALSGTSRSATYTDSGIAPDTKISTVYRYIANGSCAVMSSIYAYQAVNLSYNGFIQANPPDWTGNNLWAYVPRMTAYTDDSRTWDFAAMANVSTLGNITAWNMTPARWSDANNPPDRMAMLVKTAGGTAVSTFAMGYSPLRAIGMPATRKTLIGAEALEMYGSSRKVYFHGIDNQGSVFSANTLPAGACYDVAAYRIFINPATVPTATVAAWFRDGLDIVWLLDFHQSVNLTIAVPADQVGKSITVIDKTASFALAGSMVTPEGLTVTVTGGYGYAVMRLT